MSEREVKACPRCGYTPTPHRYEGGRLAGRWHMRDPNCELSMPPEDTRDEAIHCWNVYYAMTEAEFEAWNRREET